MIAHDETNLEHGYGGPQDPAVLTGPVAVAALLDGFDIEKAERVERDVDTAEGPRGWPSTTSSAPAAAETQRRFDTLWGTVE